MLWTLSAVAKAFHPLGVGPNYLHFSESDPDFRFVLKGKSFSFEKVSPKIMKA